MLKLASIFKKESQMKFKNLENMLGLAHII